MPDGVKKVVGSRCFTLNTRIGVVCLPFLQDLVAKVALNAGDGVDLVSLFLLRPPYLLLVRHSCVQFFRTFYAIPFRSRPL